jgi:hypothetical protein
MDAGLRAVLDAGSMGVSLWLNDSGEICYEPEEKATPELLERLRRNRASVTRILAEAQEDANGWGRR